jgi:hypothetical protein
MVAVEVGGGAVGGRGQSVVWTVMGKSRGERRARDPAMNAERQVGTREGGRQDGREENRRTTKSRPSQPRSLP